MENASEGTHSNKNRRREESAGLSASTFGLPPRHSLDDVQAKRNTEMWQNISGENLRLLNSKMLFIFGST